MKECCEAQVDRVRHNITTIARERIECLERELAALSDRIQTIADEAFGPFPTEPADWCLSQIEGGIAKQRAELSRLERVLGLYSEDGPFVVVHPERLQALHDTELRVSLDRMKLARYEERLAQFRDVVFRLYKDYLEREHHLDECPDGGGCKTCRLRRDVADCFDRNKIPNARYAP